MSELLSPEELAARARIFNREQCAIDAAQAMHDAADAYLLGVYAPTLSRELKEIFPAAHVGLSFRSSPHANLKVAPEVKLRTRRIASPKVSYDTADLNLAGPTLAQRIREQTLDGVLQEYKRWAASDTKLGLEYLVCPSLYIKREAFILAVMAYLEIIHVDDSFGVPHG